MKQLFDQKFRGAQLVNVLKVEVLEGAGKDAQDVCRIVTYFVDPESGRVLAMNDPFPNGVYVETTS